jgi:formate hydrogenlyase transcriptional activator
MPETSLRTLKEHNADVQCFRLNNRDFDFSELIGRSAPMQELYKLMAHAAESEATALLLGETGTGKELVAKAIHNHSRRNKNPLVTINCGALPPSLIESEFFGHERGSFTGATNRRLGKFEIAEKGTIFLDEIGELPLELQAKLLRVLQEREFERVGGNGRIKANVRVIAATNRNLQQEVLGKTFRSDLFFRLNIFPVPIPPLRDRMGDLDDLIDFFICKYSKSAGKEISGISPAARNVLENYSWPGNVRELEHTIHRQVILSNGPIIKQVTLFGELPENGCVNISWSMHKAERAHIIKALNHCKWRISGKGGAAELLELPATTLHSKMAKLKIRREFRVVDPE